MQNNNNNKHLILEHKISSIIYIEQYYETVGNVEQPVFFKKKL